MTLPSILNQPRDIGTLSERLRAEAQALRHVSFHGAPWDTEVMMADLDVIDIAGLADLLSEAASAVSFQERKP